MQALPRPLRLNPWAADYTPQEVAELLEDERVQLIDVRQRHEHEAGRIAGARLIELGELSAAAGSIDPKRPVVFYCRSGGRSAMATEAFARRAMTRTTSSAACWSGTPPGSRSSPTDGTSPSPDARRRARRAEASP